MKLAIVNLKDTDHTICLATGQRVVIGPKKYHLVDSSESERDYSIWFNMSPENVARYGLKVVTDEIEICGLDSGTSDTDYKDVSIVDGFVSPVAKEIADSVKVKPEKTETDKPDDTGSFKESELLEMDKEDLFNLCDNFNIKYKKNNSVKTLVNLLIENGVGFHDIS